MKEEMFHSADNSRAFNKMSLKHNNSDTPKETEETNKYDPHKHELRKYMQKTLKKHNIDIEDDNENIPFLTLEARGGSLMYTMDSMTKLLDNDTSKYEDSMK